MRRRARGWPLVSWVALALSALVAGVALQRAVVVDALPTAAMGVQRNAPLMAAGDITDNRIPALRLSNDPFRLDRRLPNDRVADASPPDTVLPVSVVAIRLLGTVVRPTGGFAVCQLATDVPRIVHVGERLGEMTLITLEQGRAVFQAPKGARLELSLTSPRS